MVFAVAVCVIAFFALEVHVFYRDTHAAFYDGYRMALCHARDEVQLSKRLELDTDPTAILTKLEKEVHGKGKW